MKTVLLVLTAIALGVVVLTGGVWLGLTLSQDRLAFAGFGPAAMMGFRSTTPDWTSGWTGAPCDAGTGAYGMMGDRWGEGTLDPSQAMPCGQPYAAPGPAQGAPCDATGGMPCGQPYSAPGTAGGEALSIEEAGAAVEAYVDRLGYEGLEVEELMEFDLNFYAIVAEKETGIGAMEVLVNKYTGAVGPEPGPNMMWNASYGMMGRGGMMGYGSMMGGYSSDGTMTVSPEEATEIAQQWLDTNLPGREAGEADAFHGYYTLHFLRDGEIEGMLSVHGASGDVWYHSWHGDFVAMLDEHS